MSRNLVLPFFAVPPKEYSQEYMTEMVRSFSVYLTQMQNPGEGRHTGWPRENCLIIETPLE